MQRFAMNAIKKCEVLRLNNFLCDALLAEKPRVGKIDCFSKSQC